METNLDLQNRKKKAESSPISTAIGAKETGSHVSSPEDGIASGIASPPKTVLIGGIPHLNLPDQKFPGPLSMVANAAGATIAHIATAPFGNRAEERLAANRSELNNDTLPADQQAKPQGIATPPVTPPTPVNQPVKAGRDSHGVITAESAQAAMGADMQRSGGIFGTMDLAGVNAINQRANNIRQEMIDAQPVGGANILPDRNEIENAEKTARWRQDDLIYQARQGNQAAIAAVINANAAAATEASRANTEAGKTAVAARGQDQQAKSDAAKIAGNPNDNQLKIAQAGGIAATTDSAKMIADIQRKAIGGDAQALATYRALTGKDPKAATDRYMAVQGGEEIGPDGMTKIKRPGGVFDSQTQKFVSMNGEQQAGPSQADLEHTAKKHGMTVEQVKAKLAQQAAPASALDYLKNNPTQAAAFKSKYGYLPEGYGINDQRAITFPPNF